MLIEKSHVGFRVQVPCKINLFLDVLGKRNDGYHSLDTVMMGVSLVDELEITPRDDDQLTLEVVFPEGFGQSLDGDDFAWQIPANQSNLIVQALKKLRLVIGSPDAGAHVKLIKRIPALAGLGGGSADAAAALVLGVLLWTNQSNGNQAISVASELGSDVNFFLEGNRDGYWLARCTGRGEWIESLPCWNPLHFVVVHPPRGCSTKEVFSSLTLTDGLARNPTLLIEALAGNQTSAIGRELFNRLEEGASRSTNWVERTRKRLDRYDHHGQCLSGSGSARFCLCSNREVAEKIVRDIQLHGEMRAYYATSWQSPGIAEQMARVRINA